MDMYTVIRTDAMSGTDDRSAVVTCRVFDAQDKPIAVENGTIVEIVGMVSGEREVMKAKLATANSNKAHCAVVATPEVMYDERKKNLDEFVNEAGKNCRCYIPRSANRFAVTAKGFVGTVPAVGGSVGIGTGGKLDAASTKPLGSCIAIEPAGRYTYYVIFVD